MDELLRLSGVYKFFPGVVALNNVGLTVRRGEVLALIGENGAGKSTLIKILAGVYKKDAGQIIFDGQKTEIPSPHAAQTLGISVIFQELNLLPNLSVAENIFMGRENRWGKVFVHRRRSNDLARELMARVGLSVHPDTLVKDLPISQRQMVEVAKALSLQAKLIIMDEPTSSLAERETRRLFEIVRSLKEAGISVIFISHRLNEVFEIADRAHVLRDGVGVGCFDRKDMTEEALIQLMVGRELSSRPGHGRARTTIHAREPSAPGEKILSVRHLSSPGILHDISLDLRRGEILGLAGLVGSGRTELVRVLFGVDPYASGEIHIDGKPVRIRCVEDAIRHGLALVPEDRRAQGLILGMTVRENGTLAALQRIQKAGFIRRKAEQAIIDGYIDRLSIKTTGREQKVANLSGGNQQKVVLAKWLATEPRVLILDEPTRGIDVGAKEEIHNIVSDLARQGVGIIMISSELPEILEMSDRILVMHEGRVTGELSRAEATQEKIMQLAIG